MESKSYAQFETDLLIKKYFPDGYIGKCIEVGAAHPIQGNNTYLFETEGWECYLIEPNPNALPLLREHRKLVFNFACGDKDLEDQEFNICTLEWGEQGAISGLKIDQDLLDQHEQYNPVLSTIKTNVKTLNNFIAEENISDIDFISIDTEGTELDVLMGLDLNRIKPKLFIIENNHNEDKFQEYLKHYGYEKTERSGVNDFYYLEHNVCNYLCSGRLGDLIHSVYVIQKDYERYGTKANLYVTGENDFLPGDSFSESVENAVSQIYPILIKQEFINKIEVWKQNFFGFEKRLPDRFIIINEHPNYSPEYINLSSWRKSPLLFKRGWTEILSKWYGIYDCGFPIKPWIKIDPDYSFSDKVLVFRNPKRQNDLFPWELILKNNNCIFVDLNDRAFNDFKYKELVELKTFDSLENLFRALSGCKFYVGNLTGITAFAHSMGVPRLIELDELGDGNLDVPHYYCETELFQNMFCISYGEEFTKTEGIEKFLNLTKKEVSNKFTIVATYNENYQEMAKITVEDNFKQYCEIHGYDLYVDKMVDRDFNRDPQWHKIKLLRKLLDELTSEWLFFIDCDCLIMDQSKKLESFVEDGINFIVPSNEGAPDTKRFDKFGGDSVISSQMLIRNCEWSKRFLDEIWDSPDIEESIDINSFDHEMRQMRISIDKPEFKDQCRVVPNYVLNRFWYNNNPFINRTFPTINRNVWVPGDFIVHVVGYPTDERVNIISQLTHFVGGIISEWKKEDYGISFTAQKNLKELRIEMKNSNYQTEVYWTFHNIKKGTIYSMFLGNLEEPKIFICYGENGNPISAKKL